MSPLRYFPIDYEVGALVLLLHSIDWVYFFVPAGELAIIIKLYNNEVLPGYVYDCRIKLICGTELDVWFGEIKKTPEESE